MSAAEKVSHKRSPDLHRFRPYSLFGPLCSVSFSKFCFVYKLSRQAALAGSADLAGACFDEILLSFTENTHLVKITQDQLSSCVK